MLFLSTAPISYNYNNHNKDLSSTSYPKIPHQQPRSQHVAKYLPISLGATSCHPSEGPCYVTAYENNANPNPNKKFMELLKFLNKCLLGLELGLFSYAMT